MYGEYGIFLFIDVLSLFPSKWNYEDCDFLFSTPSMYLIIGEYQAKGRVLIFA